MQQALNTYQFMRTQCAVNPVDACTDAAQFHGIPVADLAQALISKGIAQGRDAQRLMLIAH